jgi:hypothetical protein
VLAAAGGEVVQQETGAQQAGRQRSSASAPDVMICACARMAGMATLPTALKPVRNLPASCQEEPPPPLLP